jgi:ubiquinol-cytochrome c reductase cytochrome b subunit
MFGSIIVLCLLPWLDRSPVKSIRYRGGIYKKALAIFVVSFVVLGYLGTQPATHGATIVARIFTTLYFCFFLLMPIYTRWEKTKPVTERLTKTKTLDDRVVSLKKTFNEVTVPKVITTKTGKAIHVRKPDAKGILVVIIRLTKRLKESFD